MATLLLQLVGPMQSWGTSSRFNQRETGKEPSKSGVIGLLAAAMGIDRGNWSDIEPLTRLTMGVRHDRPGIPRQEYQTAGCAKSDVVIKADGKPSKDGIVSKRGYLADAAFLVGLEGNDSSLLKNIQNSIFNPFWPLCLGRKSYIPSEPIWLEDGFQDRPLLEALKRYPWIAAKRPWEKTPEDLMISLESGDNTGVLKMDQPISSFAERRFGARFVLSDWYPFPKEAAYVS